MADIFVDKIVHNENLLREWHKITKDFIKVNGFKSMLKEFMEVAEEFNEEYYRKNGIPNRIFKEYTGGKKITEIADDFGLLPLGKKSRICPFHKDTNPSLSLSDSKGVFNCFGCGAKGNILKFYAMLKKVKKDDGGNN